MGKDAPTHNHGAVTRGGGMAAEETKSTPAPSTSFPYFESPSNTSWKRHPQTCRAGCRFPKQGRKLSVSLRQIVQTLSLSHWLETPRSPTEQGWGHGTNNLLLCNFISRAPALNMHSACTPPPIILLACFVVFCNHHLASVIFFMQQERLFSFTLLPPGVEYKIDQNNKMRQMCFLM